MTWWRRLLLRKHLDAQLDRELSFHLEQHAADLVTQGVEPEEARRQARLALGGPEQVKEQCRDARGTRWLEDLAQDVRYALRSLRHRPGFTAVTLSTLALGIGATTVMFTVIDGVLLKPLVYPEPERLVALHGNTKKYGDELGVSYPNFRDCARESRSLGSIAAWRYSGGILSEPGPPEYVDSREISSGLFQVFGIPLTRGRAFLREDDRPAAAPVAIISAGLWQRRFAGSSAAVGSRLVFDGNAYTIVGVAPPGFQLDGAAEVFTPLGQNRDVRMQNRAANFLRVVARLGPGIAMSQAQADLSVVGRNLAAQYPDVNAGRTFYVRTFRRELVGDVEPTLWLLLGAVSLVLLIACANVASLLLARAVSREREFAMRVALGAGRGRLMRQCLTEGGFLGLCGGALGFMLAAAAFHPFLALWPGSLPRAAEVHLDWRVLVFAAGASLGSGLLFGLAPALRAPAHALEQALRANARTVAGNSHHLHRLFVTGQIALTIVLLIAAGILGRAVLRLSSLDPGIEVAKLLVTRVALSPAILNDPAQVRAAWRDVLNRARHVPGVQSAALSDIIPMREGYNGLGYWTTPAAPPLNQLPVALASCVTPDYLKVMRIPLRRGRFFDDQDRYDTEPVVVIDEVLAQRAFPHQDPVGQRLWIQAIGPTKVVGVVGHVRYWGLADDDLSQVRDQLYYPFAQIPDKLVRLFSSFMSMAVRTGTPPLSAVAPLRRELLGASGDGALYEVRTMEQLVSSSLGRQRFLMTLFGAFAGVALLLACIGIYGVLAYLTSQRIPEFGVRIALGASAADVLRLVLGQSLKMTLAGAGIGVTGALAAARVLERTVAGVRSFEPLTFAAMTLILLATALFAAFLPARRASRVDPMTALRQE